MDKDTINDYSRHVSVGEFLLEFLSSPGNFENVGCRNIRKDT